MKLITYTSFGGNIPDAIRNYAMRHGITSCADASLVEFVESFKNNRIEESGFYTMQKNNPDKLFYCASVERDGIRYDYYYGYCSDNNQSTQIAVNTYDENAVKTMITAYDGRECLRPLPEYIQVEDVPGLYKQKG